MWLHTILPPKIAASHSDSSLNAQKVEEKKCKPQVSPPPHLTLPAAATMAQPFLLAQPDILSAEGIGRAFLSEKGPNP